MKNILITRRESEFEKCLYDVFVREGYNIFVDNPENDIKIVEPIDLYIDVSDERDAADVFTIRDGIDEDLIGRVYKRNVLDSMRLLEKYLPLSDKGEGKCLCFLSGAEASINETRDKSGYAYKLSKAAMHNFYQMVLNRLSPDGYSIRIYDPMCGEVDAKAAAEGAFNYFTRRRGSENDDTSRDDETRSVLRDALGREHSW